MASKYLQYKDRLRGIKRKDDSLNLKTFCGATDLRLREPEV
jgi:hypothetical protein